MPVVHAASAAACSAPTEPDPAPVTTLVSALVHGLARGPIYYGWILVALAFVTSAVSFGTRSAFAVFLVALVAEFGWSRGEVSGILSISSLSWAVGSPVVGALMDRRGPRVVFPVAGVIMGAGLLLTASLSELPHLYLSWGVLAALPFSAMQISHQSVSLAAWFPNRRGFVNAIGAAGGGVGILVLVPLAQHLISTFGWRLALTSLGAIILLVVVVPNALLQLRRPEDVGLVAETPPRGTKTPAREHRGPTMREALHSPRFYILAVGLFCGAFPLHILLIHQVAALVDAGLARDLAANVLGIAGFLASVLTIAIGWISDHFGRERTYTVGALCLAAAAGVLIVVAGLGASPLLVILFVATFAPGFASRQGLHPAIMGDLVRGPSFGVLVGILSGILAVGTGLGPWVAGVLFDLTGSYRLPLSLAIASSLVGLLCIWIAAPRRGWR